jgi:hypothetical protein
MDCAQQVGMDVQITPATKFDPTFPLLFSGTVSRIMPPKPKKVNKTNNVSSQKAGVGVRNFACGEILNPYSRPLLIIFQPHTKTGSATRDTACLTQFLYL